MQAWVGAAWQDQALRPLPSPHPAQEFGQLLYMIGGINNPIHSPLCKQCYSDIQRSLGSLYIIIRFGKKGVVVLVVVVEERKRKERVFL